MLTHDTLILFTRIRKLVHWISASILSTFGWSKIHETLKSKEQTSIWILSFASDSKFKLQIYVHAYKNKHTLTHTHTAVNKHKITSYTDNQIFITMESAMCTRIKQCLRCWLSLYWALESDTNKQTYKQVVTNNQSLSRSWTFLWILQNRLRIHASQCLFLCFMYCALFSMGFFPPIALFLYLYGFLFSIVLVLLHWPKSLCYVRMCAGGMHCIMVVVLLSVLAIPFSQMALLTSFSLLISSTMTMLQTSTIWCFGHIGCWWLFFNIRIWTCICCIWHSAW